MAEQDLQRFLRKVEQLQEMVDSLDKVEGRRVSLAACENHNQVIALARSWGYEIGRRWGTADPSDPLLPEENLLGRSIPPIGHEQKYLIKEGCYWRLELIYSCDASSEDGFWYNQNEHEWIVLLRGSASIRFKSPEGFIDLDVGDHLHLQPHRLHRVERTDPFPGTVWLALYWMGTSSIQT